MERTLAGFQARATHGRTPKRPKRVIGGVVGTYRHQRAKRNQQRRNAYNWT